MNPPSQSGSTSSLQSAPEARGPDKAVERSEAYVKDNLVSPTPRDYIYALNLVLIGMNLVYEERVERLKQETARLRNPQTAALL